MTGAEGRIAASNEVIAGKLVRKGGECSGADVALRVAHGMQRCLAHRGIWIKGARTVLYFGQNIAVTVGDGTA